MADRQADIIHRVVERLSRVHNQMRRDEIPHQAVGFDVDEIDAVAQAGRNWERLKNILDLFEAGETSAEIVMHPQNRSLQELLVQLGLTYTQQTIYNNGAASYIVRRSK